MIDFNKLKALPREELVTLAYQHGLQVHWKAKAETIANQIIEHVTKVQPRAQEIDAPQPKPQESKHHNTPEEVEDKLVAVKAKGRLHTSYGEDNTWHFRYVAENGRTLLEESGNLDIPIGVIVRRAQAVARGPLVLRGLNQHFDPLPVGGNNAYTNTVLV